ncbi:hypothetical protein ANTPLA_LOCUS3576 [Anthophora plagiata]
MVFFRGSKLIFFFFFCDLIGLTVLTGSVEQFQERGRMKNDCTRRRRRRMPSLADSVAPNAVYPPFFLGRGNKEVGPLLKKTESRQYRAGPVDCLRKQ